MLHDFDHEKATSNCSDGHHDQRVQAVVAQSVVDGREAGFRGVLEFGVGLRPDVADDLGG